MSPLSVFAVAALVVFLGSVVQGSVGLGMNLVAAPLLALVDPTYVPVPLLLPLLALTGLTWWREHEHVHWSGVGLISVGRALGSVAGLAVVATLPPREFSVAVGALVLAFVVLSLTSWRPKQDRPALLVTGFASGLTGTASSIGGPPVALLYQYSRGPNLRATMAAISAIGTLISLAVLGGGGEITATHLLVGAGLLPFMAAGFAVSSPLRRFVDGRWIRTGVLTLSAGSALVLIVRGLLS